MKGIDKRRKQVLTIECDSRTLANQDLAVGGEIKNGLQLVCPRNGIDLIETADKNGFDVNLNLILHTI